MVNIKEPPVSATSAKLADISSADLLRGFDCFVHDLKHPLSLLPHYLAELQREHQLPANSAPLQRLQSLVRSAQALVDNALLMDKILLGSLSVTKTADDFNSIVTEASGHFAAVCERAQITLVIETDASLPPVPVDPSCFPRVIYNLVSNSVKYTPSGGTIRVATRREGDSALMIISDTGRGMDLESFANLFQPYCRLDPREYEGTGLGLFIVKSLVTAHGGQVTLDSAPDEGTVCTISVPLSEAR